MPKAYWVTVYRSISDPRKLEAYAELAPPAVTPFGARYIARGTAAAAFESGQKERIVISEFPSLEKAIAAYNSPRCPRRRRGARHPHRGGDRLTLKPRRQVGAIAKSAKRPYIRAIRDLACLAVSP
jgi:uncharacterized protein (DUF1330 family)